MRHIIRLQSLSSSSSYKLLNSQLSSCQVSCLSSLSKLSRLSNSKKTQEPHLKCPAEGNAIGSLFKEITEILGAGDVIADKTPSGISIFEDTHLRNNVSGKGSKLCAPDVCRNADVNDELSERGSLLELNDSQIAAWNEIDVSPVVHEITGIVRAENGVLSMEERLESLDLRFEPEIVEKVLKRCFKVPHLALRFFNWVKLRDGFRHTTNTYNTMLYIAAEAKEFRVAENLMEEMEKNSCEKDIKTWTILTMQYGKANLTGKALFFFDSMRKSGHEPDLKAYRTVVHSLCNSGKGDVALELYKEMVQKNMEPNLSLYDLLLTCMAKLGDADAVKLVADDMIKVSQIPERDVHLRVLKSYCIAGKIREALELIRDIKNKELPIDREYFEILVKGLCKAGRMADALEIVEIMKKRDFFYGKVYGTLISGYLRGKEISKAMDLFCIMKESGHLPPTSTYTELIQHLFHLNEYYKGCELYNDMLERGIETDGVTIMALVSGYVRQNHISEAWKLFKTMADKGIKVTWKFYSIFINELCKVSRTDEILKVLHEMQVSMVFIHRAIFKSVMSYLQKRGDSDNIKKVKQMQTICGLQSVDNEVCSNDAPMEVECHMELRHNPLGQEMMDCHSVKPLSKGYNEQDLQETCKILSSWGNWSSIQEVLENCAIQFTPELVVEVLRSCRMHGNAALHFFSWVGTQTGYCHTTETYNMAMKISGSGKDFRHMRNLFYEMRRKGCLITPGTWTIVVMQYGRAGLTEMALKFFHEMKANGVNPTRSAFKCLIICLCGRKGRKVDEAIKIFQEMIHAGYTPDKELVDTYLRCLCEVGKLFEARRCADSLRKVGFTIPLSYSIHFRALCRAGRLEEALTLINEMEADQSTKLDQFTFGSLVHGLLRHGREEEALAKIESMNLAGCSPTAHVYTSLIVHFFKEKQVDKALETFRKMQLQGCEPTIVTCSALIRGYMDTGNVAEAWKVYHSLKQKGPAPDFKTYSMFISCLCRTGGSEEALQLISDMLDNGIFPSTVNYRTVFYGLNREGKRSIAQSVLQQKLALKAKRKFLT